MLQCFRGYSLRIIQVDLGSLEGKKKPTFFPELKPKRFENSIDLINPYPPEFNESNEALDNTESSLGYSRVISNMACKGDQFLIAELETMDTTSQSSLSLSRETQSSRGEVFDRGQYVDQSNTSNRPKMIKRKSW